MGCLDIIIKLLLIVILLFIVMAFIAALLPIPVVIVD